MAERPFCNLARPSVTSRKEDRRRPKPGLFYMSSVSPAVPSSATPPHDPDSFAALFEESLSRKEMRVGEVITAEVVAVDHNFVTVNAGLKSESHIPLEE